MTEHRPGTTPMLLKPRFRYVQNTANAVLMEMDRPMPPMPLEEFAALRKWKLKYMELFGPEGYMMKFIVKNKVRFGIYIATDLNLSGTSTTQIKRSQYWTLAHEIGHILLHGDYLLDSSHDDSAIDDTTRGNLEVEAHWFASRLLMPDYVFQNYWDLNPERLADKCQVNITPAQRRIDGLSPPFRQMISKIEPWQAAEQRSVEYGRSTQSRYADIWAKDEDRIERWRRIYGYE